MEVLLLVEGKEGIERHSLSSFPQEGGLGMSVSRLYYMFWLWLCQRRLEDVEAQLNVPRSVGGDSLMNHPSRRGMRQLILNKRANSLVPKQACAKSAVPYSSFSVAKRRIFRAPQNPIAQLPPILEAKTSRPRIGVTKAMSTSGKAWVLPELAWVRGNFLALLNPHFGY